MKKTSLNSLVVLTAMSVLAATSAQAGVLTIDTNAPSAGIENTTYNNNVGADAGSFTTVGQTFTVGSAFTLDKITLVKGSLQSYNHSSGANGLTLTFFNWDGADASTNGTWASGDGTTDLDPLDGTSMTAIYSETFTFTETSIAEGSYIHFDITDQVLVAGGTYGFNIAFDYGGIGADNMNFKQASSGNEYLGGMKIATTDLVNQTSANADLAFGLTVVPEPSSYALLAGLVGLSYVMVRRRS